MRQHRRNRGGVPCRRTLIGRRVIRGRPHSLLLGPDDLEQVCWALMFAELMFQELARAVAAGSPALGTAVRGEAMMREYSHLAERLLIDMREAA